MGHPFANARSNAPWQLPFALPGEKLLAWNPYDAFIIQRQCATLQLGREPALR